MPQIWRIKLRLAFRESILAEILSQKVKSLKAEASLLFCIRYFHLVVVLGLSICRGDHDIADGSLPLRLVKWHDQSNAI